MPLINVEVGGAVSTSGRARQVSSMFDVPAQKRHKLTWKIDAPWESKPWNVGLIVGPSGAGKTTIMRHVFGDSTGVENAVLGIFKQGYQPHQPREWLIENVQLLVGGALDVGSAGLLRGGAVAWLQVEETDNMITPSGVEYRPFITAATSFDGSLATTYKVGVTVVVCDNTMAAALNEKSAEVRIRHTRWSHLNEKAMRDTLGIVEQAGASFASDVERLTNWTVTDREWELFLNSLCPIDPESKRGATLNTRKQEQLRHLWIDDPRVQAWAGTAFGVVQATNTWAHHVQVTHQTSRVERNMLRSINGTTDKSDAATLSRLAKVCQLA